MPSHQKALRPESSVIEVITSAISRKTSPRSNRSARRRATVASFSSFRASDWISSFCLSYLSASALVDSIQLAALLESVPWRTPARPTASATGGAQRTREPQPTPAPASAPSPGFSGIAEEAYVPPGAAEYLARLRETCENLVPLANNKSWDTPEKFNGDPERFEAWVQSIVRVI